MTVISSKEFATKPARYYNLAQNEQVVIKRGKNRFHLTCDNTNTKERVYYEPDDDFYRSISMNELRKRVKEDIHQWYKGKNESNSITRSTAIS